MEDMVLVAGKNLSEEGSLFTGREDMETLDERVLDHLSCGGRAKEDGERGLALESALHSLHFGFAGEETGETCKGVFGTELGAFVMLSNLTAGFFQEMPGFGEGTDGLGRLRGWSALLDEVIEIYIHCLGR